MSRVVRVGILDSGVDAGCQHMVFRARSFSLGNGDVQEHAAIADHVGHGSQITRLIVDTAPGAEIHHAQVFGARFTSAPAIVAAGLNWLVNQHVNIINMSFGMPNDRAVLRAACEHALSDGILIFAAAPAQGKEVYPASWPGVISVTGDARCREKGQISDLLGKQADFGTWCASPEQGGGNISGSSVATAHFTGLAARYLSQNPDADRDGLMAAFKTRALYLGPEHRVAEAKS